MGGRQQHCTCVHVRAFMHICMSLPRAWHMQVLLCICQRLHVYLRVCLFEKRHDAFVCVCEEKVMFFFLFCFCAHRKCAHLATVGHFWCISEKQVCFWGILHICLFHFVYLMWPCALCEELLYALVMKWGHTALNVCAVCFCMRFLLSPCKHCCLWDLTQFVKLTVSQFSVLTLSIAINILCWGE